MRTRTVTITTVCDRCDTPFEDGNGPWESGIRIVDYNAIEHGEDAYRSLDLCPACREELRKWWECE